MQKKSVIRTLSVILALALIFSLLPPVRTYAEPAAGCSGENVLRVGVNDLTGNFSPFYCDNSYDQEVLDLVNLNLLTLDRRGYIISNAIEGETVNYNGTDYTYTGPANINVNYLEEWDVTVYTAKLREDLKFWDGEPVTAKDVLFTYYTFLDPAYTGSNALRTYDIVGLRDWRTQTTEEVYDKYAAIADAIYSAGRNGYSENDMYTEDLYNAYWAALDQAWTAQCQTIVDYCVTRYGSDDYVQAYFNPDMTWEQLQGKGEVAFVMGIWGFGSFNDDGLFAAGDNTWDLVETFPTIEDYYNVTYAAYAGDAESFYAVESTGYEAASVLDNAINSFITACGPQDPAMGGESIPSISGIKMIDDYTVEITVNGFEAYAVYTVLDVPITPMHYYGDPAKWDPDNGKYGFDRGNLEKVMELKDVPRGAGPYIFESYMSPIVTLSANPNWYKGEPLIETIRFNETALAEIPTAISWSDIDIADITGSRTRFQEIAANNSNGQLSGDVITTFKTDYLGYGYIGINAKNVNVNRDPDSDASKALRKALATILAVYREANYTAYYGEAAKVIEYPISDSSWAAPQTSDPDYRTAFSQDANGNTIYTPDMTAAERYAAAKAAALTWFQAAGYTVRNGKVTAAPTGAKLSYEVIIPADGQGDHPSYGLLTMAKAAFAQIGITLNIKDPADPNVLWDALDAETQELWCAAWGATVDPDMYPVYHSSNIVGHNGTDSNYFHIQDDDLDQMLTEASSSDDQSVRKYLYRQCLNIIMDWGVEIPAYQRQNALLFSTERIDLNTLTPDITTFWDWKNDIEKLQMKNTNPHVWNEGVTVEPTCTEDGAIVYTCVICGQTKSEPLPALGHSFEKGVCTRCGYAAQAASEIFDDVRDGRWYAEAVLWAVQNGITTGTGDRTFSPNNTCTRAQVMTFLWHAEGDPNPADTDNPFNDNREGKWYYNAVLWAYHHDPQITSGTSETTFGINDGCTREQVVTFLWKTAGAPEPETTENPFQDVKEGKWYYKAVLWAYENQITSGISEDTFGVHSTCTRAQIVTFLYKAYN